MRKAVIIAVVCMIAGAWGNLKAQGCAELLEPYFKINRINPEEYPKGKMEWRCMFARAAFYMTDRIPKGAPVHNISELKDVFTGENLSEDFEVKVDELSYYAYDFKRFQYMHSDQTVYFRLKKGKNKYLALRPIVEMMDRASNPDHYEK